MPADEEVATRAAQVAVALLVTLTVVAVPIVVPVISAIGDWFCSTDDDNPRAADHHETTRLPHQPPTSPYTRNSCTRSQSQTAGPNPATLDYYRSGSPLTSPDAGQSRQTLPASAHTQTSYQLLSTPLFSQATVRNLATTDYDRSLYDPNSAPPSAGESHQATSTSIHTQASYQRSPSPELAYISEFYQSSPTHPRTQLSPSAHLQEPTATAVGRNTLTPVVQPSPVLAALSDLDSEEPEDAEDVDTAKKLREEAQRERHEMYGALARAESAHERGDEKAERTHNQQAIVHENAINQLDTKEAGISKKNAYKRGKVDLHGLCVREALQFAEQELQSASQRGDKKVHFIVGKGLHSENGRPVIRPALKTFCNKHGLTYSLDPRNAGVLTVQVD